MNETLTRISKKLKKQMDHERFEHTRGVMYTAAALSMRYGTDMEQAMLAGLLHDCAKIEKIHSPELLELCRKNNIPITDAETRKPSLLHAKAGAYLAKAKHGINDPEILSAIVWHTTGKPDMSLLDKIIFIADYIEPGRIEADNLSIVRKLAFIDIDECLYRILKDSLAYLKKKKDIIDPKTEETYQYYKKRLR